MYYIHVQLVMLAGLFAVCPAAARVRTVNSPGELQQAIDNAQAGDKIILGPTTFNGVFIAKGQGTLSSPITVVGTDSKTKIIGNGGGTAFTVLGNHWVFENFVVFRYNLGFFLKGAGIRLKGLVIGNVMEAIDIPGNRATVSGCVIERVSTYGIRVRANNTLLTGNVIQDAGRVSINIENGTCCGTVKGNVASSSVLVKGSGYSFVSNVFDGYMEVTGCWNSIHTQVSPTPVFTKRCPNTQLWGNVFT